VPGFDAAEATAGAVSSNAPSTSFFRIVFIVFI
jgi:hypothetical protein